MPYKDKNKRNEKDRKYYYSNHELRKKQFCERVRKSNALQRATNPAFRIKESLRSQLKLALNTYTKTGKMMSSQKYGIDYQAIINKLTPLPFPIEERKNWHIDHIIPVSKFDLTNPEEVKKAFHPNNLQWLPASENIRKGNRI